MIILLACIFGVSRFVRACAMDAQSGNKQNRMVQQLIRIQWMVCGTGLWRRYSFNILHIPYRQTPIWVMIDELNGIDSRNIVSLFYTICWLWMADSAFTNHHHEFSGTFTISLSFYGHHIFKQTLLQTNNGVLDHIHCRYGRKLFQ